MSNPFDDEAQTETVETEAPKTEEPAAKPARKTATKKTTAVEESGEGKVTVTLKGGSGFDAPWIVIHAADVVDALSEFEGENASALAALMDKVSKAGAHFAKQGPAAPARGGSSGGSNGRPAGADQPPAGFPALPAGAVYKTGVAKAGPKAGQVWHAYDLADGKRQYVNEKDGQYFLSAPK